MSFLDPNPNVNPCSEWTDVCVVFYHSRRGKKGRYYNYILNFETFTLLLWQGQLLSKRTRHGPTFDEPSSIKSSALRQLSKGPWLIPSLPFPSSAFEGVNDGLVFSSLLTPKFCLISVKYAVVELLYYGYVKINTPIYVFTFETCVIILAIHHTQFVVIAVVVTVIWTPT